MNERSMITMAEYSRQCGISKAMVNKLVKSGVLKLSRLDRGDGRIDRRIDMTQHVNLDDMRRRGRIWGALDLQLGTQLPTGPISVATQPTEKPVEKTLPNNPSAGQMDMGYLDPKSKPALDIEHREAQIERLRAETDKMRGVLIERSLVRRVMLEVLSIDRKQMVYISNDLTPRILSSIQVDRLISLIPIESRTEPELVDLRRITNLVTAEIDRAVNNIFAQKEQRILDFLSEIKAESEASPSEK